VHQIVRGLTVAALVTAAGVALAGDSGTKWRITTSMSGMGMSLPSRVTESCVTGSGQDQPAPTAQSDCQFTETSRSGATVQFAVQCKSMKGTGTISYASDHYSGKFDMQSDRGAMSVTYDGQKLGSCDATQANASAAGSAASSAASAVGSEVKDAAAAGATEVKDAATEVASDAAQSAKDTANQAVQDKVQDKVQGVLDKWLHR
jgi:hypothetical protein